MAEVETAGLPLLVVALSKAKSEGERADILHKFDQAALEKSLTLPPNTACTKEIALNNLKKVFSSKAQEDWEAYLENSALDVLETTPTFEDCLEETLKDEANKIKVYSAICNTFKNISNDRDIPAKMKRAVALWTPICEKNPVLSQFLNSAVSQLLCDNSDFLWKTVPKAADINFWMEALALYIDCLALWKHRQGHDTKVAQILASVVDVFEKKLTEALTNLYRSTILSTLCVENWTNFRPNRYKFLCCTPTITTWKMNMLGLIYDEDGFLCLSDETMRTSIFAKVFVSTFDVFTNSYCNIAQHISRGRWQQLRVDIFALVSIAIAFLKSKRFNLFQVDWFCKKIDRNCAILLGHFALLLGPVDIVVSSMSRLKNDEQSAYKYPSSSVKSFCNFLGI